MIKEYIKKICDTYQRNRLFRLIYKKNNANKIKFNPPYQPGGIENKVRKNYKEPYESADSLSSLSENTKVGLVYASLLIMLAGFGTFAMIKGIKKVDEGRKAILELGRDCTAEYKAVLLNQEGITIQPLKFITRYCENKLEEYGIGVYGPGVKQDPPPAVLDICTENCIDALIKKGLYDPNQKPYKNEQGTPDEELEKNKVGICSINLLSR